MAAKGGVISIRRKQTEARTKRVPCLVRSKCVFMLADVVLAGVKSKLTYLCVCVRVLTLEGLGMLD
jgi:uncharacterized protein YjhX (UPF0386 family)